MKMILSVTQLNKKMRLGECKWKQSIKQAEDLQVSHNRPISESSEIVPIEYYKELFLNFKSNGRQEILLQTDIEKLFFDHFDIWNSRFNELTKKKAVW